MKTKQNNPLLLVWDTETTGLTLHPNAAADKQPKIIEFGAVVWNLNTCEVEREYNQIINPGELVSAEITKITGITNDMLSGEPLLPQVLPRLRELFAECGAICAHNLPFDRDVLRWELERHKRLPVTELWPWPPLQRQFCTMNMYAPLWGRNPKLSELHADLALKPIIQTHRALDDARMIIDIIRADSLSGVMK